MRFMKYYVKISLMNQNKENIVTPLLVVVTFLFFVFTPGKETLGSAVQGLIIALVFFGLLPLGYHFLVLKRDSQSFGLAKTDVWNGWTVALVAVTLALIITIVGYQFLPQFREAFFLPEVVKKSLGGLVIYELLLVPFLVALYELFFRGLVQKNWLQRHWGLWAVFAQAGLFIAFLLMTASLSWALLPLILFSFFSGLLVWKNGSLIQAWLASWLYLFLFDIFVLVTS